jgi:hypothetical protein
VKKLNSFWPLRLLGLIAVLVLSRTATALAQAQSATASSAPVSTTSVPPSASPRVLEASPAKDVPFMQAFPKLSEYIYKEPKSGFYLGFGVSPLALVKDRTAFGANFFQVHYISDHFDLELFNVAYSVTRAESSVYQSNNFTMRSTAKIRIGSLVSFGPMIGYEYVSFPNLGATLLKNQFTSPDEPFSSQGLIYGAMLTETFHYKEDYLIQINQVVFQETYSNTTTAEGWAYNYDNANVQGNTGLIGPGVVTMIELSFLF